MKNAKKTRAKPKLPERELRRRNEETLLLQDLQRATLRDCTKSPRWVMSVVRAARKALLNYAVPQACKQPEVPTVSGYGKPPALGVDHVADLWHAGTKRFYRAKVIKAVTVREALGPE